MVLTRADAKMINRSRWDWVDLAWPTTRCDREQAEDAIRALYQATRMHTPDVVWRESPQKLAATLDALVAFDSPEDERQLGSRLAVEQLGVLRHRTRPATARRRFPTPIWYDPTQVLGNTFVPEALRWQVFDALSGSNVLRNLDRQGWRIKRRCANAVNVISAPALSVVNSLEEAVLWDCFLRVGGIDDPLIAAILDVLRVVGYISAWEGLAIVSDRPIVIRRGFDDAFHSERQPAIIWEDGTYLNWWNGVELPAGFWDWTGEQVIACNNLELRSIAIEYMGWEPIAESLTPLAVADDPGNPGQVIELYELAVASGLESVPAEWRHFIRVTNASPNMDGTRRSYIIQVAPWITDPVAAVAESFGVSVDMYRGLARAC